MKADPETKKLMDQLAAELAKEKRQQNKNLIAAINKKLDKAMGFEPGDNREDPSGLLEDYGLEKK